MIVKHERLEQSLQASIAPVYLVAGAEPLLVEESRDLILHAARDHGFLEREVHQAGGNYDWNAILEGATAQSLFSPRKVIDVRLPGGRPGKEGGKFLTGWAGNPDPDRLLIVSCEEWDSASRKSRWAAQMAAAGVLVEIWPVRARDLPAWIDRRMRSAGLQPEPEAVRLLSDLVEGNLLAARQEIEKLTLLESAGRVTVEMVRLSVADSARFDAFRLGESLLDGRAADCLKVASALRRNNVAIQALTGALYYQIGQLEAVRHAVARGEDENRAFGRLRVFKMSQPVFRRALRRLSGRQLADSFRALALLDRQSKGRSPGDPWQTLDRMVLEFCSDPPGGDAGREPFARAR